MKYILILIFAVSLSFSNAQYQSLFGSNSSSWNVMTSQLFGNVSDSLVYSGDTIIASQIYKKASLYTYIGLPPTSMFLIREDLVIGKAWYRELGNTTETLIYDLEMAVGDQFNTILFVDSVFYLDGRKHIRFNPQNQSTHNFMYIEGVGTSFGIVSHGLSPFLLCQHKDDTLSFVNDHPIHGGLCRPSTVGLFENSTDVSQITVYPNPTTDAVTFSLPENTKNIQLKLYTAEGKLVCEDVILPNEQNKTISLNAWNGVLFYTLESETTALSGKLVKM
jgi:hypothetical protein